MTETPTDIDLYMRYLGVLKLLEEASPYVEDELLEQIIMAHQHAAQCHETLEHKMLLRRSCIEVISDGD